MATLTIPRSAHFVLGLASDGAPFHLVHYLAITSCLEVVQPDVVYVHYHELPYGVYWDLIRPRVELNRVEPVPEISGYHYRDPLVAHYAYAHHADFVRLDVLAERGGLYADIDTLFVESFPEELWRGPAVIGREADVPDPVTGDRRPSVSNALVMAEPGAPFVETWRRDMARAFDGSWSAHSCFLAADLAERMPDGVRVEPQRSFHLFEPSRDGLRRLLVDREPDLAGVRSLHLNAHLWWEEPRRDFSDVHAAMIDEHWIRTAEATYATEARRFLPDHARSATSRRSPSPGIRYLAEDDPSGYGESSYRLVAALRAAGVTVEYRAWNIATPAQPGSIGPYSRDPQPRAEVERDAPTVAHLVPEHYPGVREEIGDGPLFGHTVWETDRLPGHWPALLNETDRVIVPSSWNRQVFAASGVHVPISVVPHVACRPWPGDRGETLTLPDDVVVFYTIARWDTRKAPWLTVEAFLEAFTVDDPVALVVKTRPDDRVRSLGRWASCRTIGLQVASLLPAHPRPPRLLLEMHDDWSDARIAGLHTRGDCYISLSRGEGWGLGAFDACAYGNPVVATGWGGPLAYLDREAAWLVDYDLVPVEHETPRSYSPDQRWAQPDVEQAAAFLREIAGDLRRARQRCAPLQDRVRREYAPPVVAHQLLAAVDVDG
jgi:glycosyltransferase involved in cell wall biosynthesis